MERVEVISLAIGATFGSIFGCLVFSYFKLDSFINPLFGELNKTIDNLNVRFKAVGKAMDKQNDVLEAISKAIDAEVNRTSHCIGLQVKINQGVSDQIAHIMGILYPNLNQGVTDGETARDSKETPTDGRSTEEKSSENTNI